MKSLREIFTAHDLTPYVDAFEAEHVAIADLPGMSDEELAETFGLRGYGDRKRFRAMVASLGTGAASLSTTDPGATRAGPLPLDPGATRAGPLPLDPGATRAGTLPADPGAARAGPAPIHSGDRLNGRYYIVKEIARGAMGAVYKAIDELTRADVAIKAISPQQVPSPQFVSLLLKEAATAQRLSHPNLLRIHHVEAGPPAFIVMEYVDGDTLTEAWLRHSRRFPAPELRGVLAQLLAGLEHLHISGVVHRDIKPDNVLLTRGGEVRLADYGISTTLKEQRQGAGSAGTLHFMPPEQLRGQVCDARADLYAVGVMTWQLLVGSLPFDAADAESARSWHLGNDRSGTTGDASLDAWIARLWAPSAGDRYASASEARQALVACDSELADERARDQTELALVESVATALKGARGMNNWGFDDRLALIASLGGLQTRAAAKRAIGVIVAFAGEPPNLPAFKAALSVVQHLSSVASDKDAVGLFTAALERHDRAVTAHSAIMALFLKGFFSIMLVLSVGLCGSLFSN